MPHLHPPANSQAKVLQGEAEAEGLLGSDRFTVTPYWMPVHTQFFHNTVKPSSRNIGQWTLRVYMVAEKPGGVPLTDSVSPY